MELNDLEQTEEKLIVSFFPGRNNESTSRLESPGELQGSRRVAPGENYCYSYCTIVVLPY